MEVLLDPKKCCACRTCIQICSKEAIKIIYDNNGFEQVCIDESKCINCGACKTVCPIISNKRIDNRKVCGSAYSKSYENRFNGSSGGLFGTFAKEIINKGGVVYGAAFDNNLHVVTTRAETINELIPLYKSKYILCDTSKSFEKIKMDLESGKIVLYCSSPCQIAGLKNYLRKEFDNLFCIEFICHGVGSQKHFSDSINYVEQKNRIKIKNFKFRYKPDKASSLHYYSYDYISVSDNRDKIKTKTDIYMSFPYYYAYEERLNCRDSCYSCKFASEKRVSDITIGDFHDIKRYESDVDRFKGVSMFVVNSDKGLTLFDLISDKLIFREYDWEIIKKNNRFSGVEKKPDKREYFLSAFSKNDYTNAIKSYLNYKKDWRWYYYHMPKFIQLIGMRILRRKI